MTPQPRTLPVPRTSLGCCWAALLPERKGWAVPERVPALQALLTRQQDTGRVCAADWWSQTSLQLCGSSPVTAPANSISFRMWVAKKKKPFSYRCNSHSSPKGCGHVAAKLLFGKLDSSVPSLLRKTDDLSLFSGFETNWEKIEVLLLSRFLPRKSVLISEGLVFFPFFFYCIARILWSTQVFGILNNTLTWGENISHH